MKKILIGAVAVIIAVFITCVVWQRTDESKGTSYSRTQVTGAVEGYWSDTMSSAGGFTSGTDYPTGSWLQKFLGRPLLVDHYGFGSGHYSLNVDIYHSNERVKSVVILSNKTSTKEAAALQSKLLKSFPDLNCSITSP